MLPTFLQADADLQALNTLALPGRAAFLGTITATAQLAAISAVPALQGKPRFILGGGSAQRFDRFRDELHLRTEVLPAASLNQAGIIGAALYAASQLAATQH